MEALYRRVEGCFRGLASNVYRHPVRYLVLVMVFALACSSQVTRLTLDASNEGFFHEDAPVLLDYDAFRKQFGREDLLYISIAPAEIFEEAFLHKLSAFHQDLEASVVHLDEVTSLLNARNTRGEGDELIVEDLVEHWPRTEAELSAIKDRAMGNPVYRDLLLSADGKVTAVAVRANSWPVSEGLDDALDGFEVEETNTADVADPPSFLSGEQNAAFVESVRLVVARHNSDDFPLALSGVPVLTETVKQFMKRDFVRFVAASLLVSIVLLLLLFRRFSGVLLPVLVIFLTLLSTLGLMAITGTAFKVQTQILPSFLMAVSIASSMHILSMFYRYYDAGGEPEQAIVDAMGHSGAPVLGAGITTAIGMLSFSNADMAPLADLGIFAGLGICLSLVYSLVLLPSLLALLPLRRKARQQRQGRGVVSGLLSLVAEFTISYRKMIIAFFLLVTLVACWGVSRLDFYHEFLSWFPEETPVRRDTYLVDEQLNGVQSFEVLIDTGKENGLYEPEILNAIEGITKRLPEIQVNNLVSNKTVSLIDVLKEINLALNENNPDYYRLPQDRQLIAQELLLFENTGSDDLEDLVDSQFSTMRVTVKLPWSDASSMEAYMFKLQSLFEQNLPSGIEVTVTGISSVYGHIVGKSKNSMAESYFIAGVVISVLMILFLGDLKLGLLAMIPNLAPIFMTLALMGILQIPLTVFSMFFGSIALGLAVDDTLHFFHSFNRYHHLTGDTRESIRLTFQSTGRALLFTTISLASGFFAFGLATMEAVQYFGLFTGLAILLALIADFVLTPAILLMMVRDGSEVSENNSPERTTV